MPKFEGPKQPIHEPKVIINIPSRSALDVKREQDQSRPLIEKTQATPQHEMDKILAEVRKEHGALEDTVVGLPHTIPKPRPDEDLNLSPEELQAAVDQVRREHPELFPKIENTTHQDKNALRRERIARHIENIAQELKTDLLRWKTTRSNLTRDRANDAGEVLSDTHRQELMSETDSIDLAEAESRIAQLQRQAEISMSALNAVQRHEAIPEAFKDLLEELIQVQAERLRSVFTKTGQEHEHNKRIEREELERLQRLKIDLYEKN